MLDIYWLFKTYCLWDFIATSVFVILLVVCSCNSVQLSLKLIKGNLLTSGFNFIFVWKRLFRGSGKLREFHFAKFVSTMRSLHSLSWMSLNIPWFSGYSTSTCSTHGTNFILCHENKHFSAVNDDILIAARTEYSTNTQCLQMSALTYHCFGCMVWNFYSHS